LNRTFEKKIQKHI